MDYNMLSLGVACADHPEYEYCYESVKNVFFDDIEGAFLENVGGRKSAEVMGELKQAAPYLAGFGAMLVGLGVACKKLRKIGNKSAADFYESSLKELEEEFNRLKNYYDKVKKEAKDPDVRELTRIEYEIDRVRSAYNNLAKEYNKLAKKLDLKEAKPMEK